MNKIPKNARVNINVAVVGAGYWGPKMIRNLRGIPGCIVVWICDSHIGNLEQFKTSCPGAKLTTRFDDLTNDPEVDVIFVVTNMRGHFDLGEKSLAAGKHTFIEKPMAASVEECDLMNELSRQKRVALMVGHTFIYSSAIREIKKAIDRGEIGEVRHIQASRQNWGIFQKDGNTAWDLAPHDISIGIHLFGEEPTSVICTGSVGISENGEDEMFMALGFRRGRSMTISSSWTDPEKIRRIKIVGTEGVIVFNDCEADPAKKVRIHKIVAGESGNGSQPRIGEAKFIGLDSTETLEVECRHFLDCVRTGKLPDTDGEQGRLVVDILEKAQESLVKGRRISMVESEVGNDAEVCELVGR